MKLKYISFLTDSNEVRSFKTIMLLCTGGSSYSFLGCVDEESAWQVKTRTRKGTIDVWTSKNSELDNFTRPRERQVKVTQYNKHSLAFLL